MTLQELINKLNYLTDHRMTKDFSTNQNSDVHFFVEDLFQLLLLLSNLYHEFI